MLPAHVCYQRHLFRYKNPIINHVGAIGLYFGPGFVPIAILAHCSGGFSGTFIGTDELVYRYGAACNLHLYLSQIVHGFYKCLVSIKFIAFGKRALNCCSVKNLEKSARGFGAGAGAFCVAIAAFKA
jgi:Na+/proline symporter